MRASLFLSCCRARHVLLTAALALAACSNTTQGVSGGDPDAGPGGDDVQVEDVANNDTASSPDVPDLNQPDVISFDGGDAGQNDVADANDPDAGKDILSIDGFDAEGFDVDSVDTTAIDIPSGCTQDVECAVPAPCVLAECKSGICTFSPATGPCDDGNACTTDDACANGKCVPGAVTDCDDKDPCTADGCDLTKGCIHTTIDAACDDGDACTTSDLCVVGLCLGATLDCDDKNVCTDDSCDATKGCVHLANTLACNDGNPCTAEDTCAAGTCTSGTGLACDDGNDCTLDTCDSVTGCAHKITAGDCSDNNACTSGDTCKNGACVPAAAVNCDDANPCTSDSCDLANGCTYTDHDGAACDDGQKCSTLDLCSGGTCLGQVANCKDDNPCTDDTCLDASGCVHLANDVTCDDGNACSLNDTCAGGKCGAQANAQCDDGNSCTKDVCDTKAGCTYITLEGPCTDGDACTASDTCDGLTCKGVAIGCDDGNVCTEDYCDKTAGCQHRAQAGACSDGDACTTGDVCAEGNCAPGEAVSCDDGNVCTVDACDKLAGCTHTATEATCSDGNACTTGDACVNGDCVPTGDAKCDDGNPCTNDGCAFDLGCFTTDANGAPCDDGQKCSVQDACQGGSCLGVVPNCDDNNPCTDDTCQDGVGCVHVANDAACSDGNACTDKDSCVDGACKGSGVVCNDNNPCTADGCDPATGCFNVVANDGAACDDGDACTKKDACSAGTCVGGNHVTCAAQDQCHLTGTCDPQTGVCSNPEKAPVQVTTNNCCASHGPGCTDPAIQACVCAMDSFCCNNAWDNICVGEATGQCGANTCQADTPPPCDDGISCTQDDKCLTTGCAGTVSDAACNDGFPCTIDSCDPVKGCQHTALTEGPCDDGNVCTLNDACGPTGCTGLAQVCNDGNPCTAEGCDPKNGCFSVASNNGLICDDASLCTQGDQCVNGTCAGTPSVVCPEPDQCHLPGTCQAATGVCDNPTREGITTTTSVCDKSDCCSTHGTGCTDPTVQACVCGMDSYCCNVSWDNLCVDEAKNQCGAANVIVTVIPATCDDGFACTSADNCLEGACLGNPNDAACDDGNVCTADSCSQTAGCQNIPVDNLPCDDGDACSTIDLCVEGGCQGTQPVVCTAIACHVVGTCDPATGECSNPLPPTTPACQTSNCCASHGPGCTDATVQACVCAMDSYCCAVSWDSLCVNEASNNCGASNPPAPPTCDDGNACTTNDTCDVGTCTPGTAVNCDDTNMCTTDGCDANTGCTHTPVLGECLNSGVGLDTSLVIQTPLVGIGDTGAIQAFTCPPGAVAIGFSGRVGGFWDQVSLNCAVLDSTGQLGATSVAGPLGTSTGGTAIQPNDCPSGTILAEVQVSTFDLGGPTTVQALGGTCLSPVQVGAKTPAAQGAALTTVTGGFPGTAQPVLDCPAGSVVTGIVGYADAWAHRVGFLCTPLAQVCLEYASVPCQDGLVCTVGDTCQNGSCGAPSAAACDDGNACTVDSCDPTLGCASAPVSGNACNDGNVCTDPDVCSSGTCVGQPISCDDGNPCTLDGCDAEGCYHNIMVGAACDDGQGCTVGDSCNSDGTCVGGPVCDGCVDGQCPFTPPPPCTSGSSGVAPVTWVVCSADANSIWLSHAANSLGNYDAGTICKQLGYFGGVTAFGGTCSNECGYCQGTTSCQAPGNQTMDSGGVHGSNADGPVLGDTVQWTCKR